MWLRKIYMILIAYLVLVLAIPGKDQAYRATCIHKFVLACNQNPSYTIFFWALRCKENQALNSQFMIFCPNRSQKNRNITSTTYLLGASSKSRNPIQQHLRPLPSPVWLLVFLLRPKVIARQLFRDLEHNCNYDYDIIPSEIILVCSFIIISVTELDNEIFLPGRFQVFVKDGSFCIFDGCWKVERHLLIYLLQSSSFKLILWPDWQFSRWSYVYGGS